MRNAARKNSHKVLASAALVVAAAGVAGLGTFGAFTSSTNASQSVSSGTVAVNLGTAGTAGNRLSVAATGIVPGDTIQRAVTLSNTGSQDFATVTLTTTATTSSLLDTDAANGLQVKVDACSVPWTEAGTAPAYTYTCTGTTSAVLASKPVIGANVALTNLTAIQATKTDNLRVTTSLLSTADNTVQGLTSVVKFDFTATQRSATNR